MRDTPLPPPRLPAHGPHRAPAPPDGLAMLLRARYLVDIESQAKKQGVRRVVGDLSDTAAVLRGLDLAADRFGEG